MNCDKETSSSFVSCNSYTSIDCTGNLHSVMSGQGSVILGIGKSGEMVSALLEDGTALGSTTIRTDGTFHIHLEQPLQNGEHVVLNTQAADGGMNPACRIVAPDYVPPERIGKVEIAADGAVVSGEQAEPGALVRVFAGETILGVAHAGPDGNFEVQLSRPQIDAEALRVYAYDGEGNASEPVELKAPDATPPQVTLKVAGNGTSVSGTVSGGDGVSVWLVAEDGSRKPVPVQFEGEGHFFGWLPEKLVNGEQLMAAAEDAAGNRWETSVRAPDLMSPDFTGVLRYDADSNRIEGGGEPGSAVSIFNAAGELCSSGRISPEGRFALDLPCKPQQGETLKVVLTDEAFNCSVRPLDIPEVVPESAAVSEPVARTADTDGLGGESLTGSDTPVSEPSAPPPAMVAPVSVVDGQDNAPQPIEVAVETSGEVGAIEPARSKAVDSADAPVETGKPAIVVEGLDAILHGEAHSDDVSVLVTAIPLPSVTAVGPGTSVDAESAAMEHVRVTRTIPDLHFDPLAHLLETPEWKEFFGETEQHPVPDGETVRSKQQTDHDDPIFLHAFDWVPSGSEEVQYEYI